MPTKSKLNSSLIGLFLVVSIIGVQKASFAQLADEVQLVDLNTVTNEIKKIKNLEISKDRSFKCSYEDALCIREIDVALAELNEVSKQDEATIGILQRSMPGHWSESNKELSLEISKDLSSCQKLVKVQDELLVLLETKLRLQPRIKDYKLPLSASLDKCVLFAGAQRDYVDLLTKKLRRQHP